MIGTVSVGKLQMLANEALLEVANCLSGAPGCAVLSNAEISVLLLGTESSSTYVREAVFKVCLFSLNYLTFDSSHPIKKKKNFFFFFFQINQQLSPEWSEQKLSKIVLFIQMFIVSFLVKINNIAGRIFSVI